MKRPGSMSSNVSCMDRRRSKRQKQISKTQEKRAARDVGGHVQAGSGNARFGGGADVRKRGELRIECKYTEKDVFILRLADLTKVKLQAIRGGMEFPVLQIDFVKNGKHDLYAVVPALRYAQDKPTIDSTIKKSIRVNQKALQKLLLSHDSVQAVFIRGEANSRDTYEIMSWHVFCFGVGEDDPRMKEGLDPDAGNQHHR